MPPITLPEFVQKWTASQRTERASAQEHFINLCDLLGQPTPGTDPTGESYAFEKGATKSTGGDGFADVWKRDRFGWEYKGKHKDLRAACQQLQQYRDALENPPLLVVCDLDRFEVHTNFTNTVKRVYAFDLAQLQANEPTPTCPLPPLDVLRALFDHPQTLRPDQTAAQVTEQAATEFARLAESLRQRSVAPEQAAHFLVRLLFCLFSEDIGLLPRNLFTRTIESSRRQPTTLAPRLQQLFAAMTSGGIFGADDIAHFNGGLFADDTVCELTADDLAVLARATRLDWSSIEPAIFGTLFERSLDPSKRAQLGAHFTSRDHIMMVVEPVLMAPLRRRWETVQRQAADLIARRDAASGRARENRQQELVRLLIGFAAEIAAVRVLDPACGSGNFLYVALKLLLDLEKEVITFAASNGLSGFFPQVGPEQLYGIEINPYAHELAQVVVWIGYIQWLHDNGFGVPSSPILKPLHNIQRMDAILAHDEEGMAVEPPWPEAHVILGNPPFLGDKRMRAELGDDYVDALRQLYAKRLPGGADLVTYWFERSRGAVATGSAQRAGLLATQAIRGGLNRRVLERIKETGDIFVAWSDCPWILDGASVHVSLVGFDRGEEQARSLDGAVVQSINANLTAASDLTVAQRLKENLNISFIGDMKKGRFEIPGCLAQQMLNAALNPNGRSNADVLRPWLNGLDLNGRIRDMWIIDFGAEMSNEDASFYEIPYEYVRIHVKPERDKVRNALERRRWWVHARVAIDMRKALAPLSRYVATTIHAKHRLFSWVANPTLASSALVAFARDDDYFFGVLHSRPHELWARARGTQVRDAVSGSRYTPTTTFETFPLPWAPGAEPTGEARVKAIANTTRELVQHRDAWLNPPGATEADLQQRTLTNLYNQRPTWLDLAHQKLDHAVLDAYSWPYDISDEAILERLLALNLARDPA